MAGMPEANSFAWMSGAEHDITAAFSLLKARKAANGRLSAVVFCRRESILEAFGLGCRKDWLEQGPFPNIPARTRFRSNDDHESEDYHHAQKGGS
jgi:hypothetical protein